MRISTQLSFDQAVQGINDRQAALNRAQQELSTGRKLLSASDDPIGAAEAERARAQLQRIAIQKRMDDYANGVLGQADSVLSSITDLTQSIRDGFVQAGNGALSDSDRALVVQQLQAYAKQLFALANTSNGAGGYLFGGQGSTTPPFATSTTGSTTSYQYNPVPGEQQAGLDSTVPVALDGDATFMKAVPAGGGHDDIFSFLDREISSLTASSGTPDVTGALAGIDSFLGNVAQQRTEVGVHMSAIAKRGDLGSAASTQLQAQISSVVDVDYAKTISDFSANQTALQAAMQSYAEIKKMSLFNYL